MIIIYLNNLLTFQGIDLASHPHGASCIHMFLRHCCLFNLHWHACLKVTLLKWTLEKWYKHWNQEKEKKNTILHLQALGFLLGTRRNSICPIFTFGNVPLAVALMSQPAIITTVDKTGRFACYIIFCSLPLQESRLTAVLENFFPCLSGVISVPGAAGQKHCIVSYWSFSCAIFHTKCGQKLSKTK